MHESGIPSEWVLSNTSSTFEEEKMHWILIILLGNAYSMGEFNTEQACLSAREQVAITASLTNKEEYRKDAIEGYKTRMICVPKGK